ncbi:MAG: hypothetical protein LQ349_008455 [Xanthoria aureola]|nr:MAG: hypothetical protein LQ349_008455 [Xanthoria aureola]
MATSAGTMALPTDHSNRAPGFIACSVVTSTAALALVSLRTYVRLAVVRKFGIDDYTIHLAMICGIIAVCLNGVQVHYGFGQHAVHLTPQQGIEIRRWNFALRIPILVGSGLSKISISLLLLRLLGNAAGRTRKYFLHGINIFVIMYTLIDIFSDVASCRPLAKVWDLQLPGKCRSPDSIISVVYFQGACASAVSLLLSVLPILFFANLQMPRRTKVVLCGLTSLGIFDMICSIVRTALLPGYEKSLDFSYTAIPITLWATLELNFAILAACIPTLRPLFRYFDSSRAGRSRYTSKQAFNKHDHSTEAHGHSFRSDQQPIPGVHNQYSLTSVGQGRGDDRSNTSTEFLRNPGGIVKTTDVRVIV